MGEGRMARWGDVVGVVQRMGGSATTGTVLTLKLNGNGPSRTQQLYVALEVYEGSVELVQVQSIFGDIFSQDTGDLLFSIFRSHTNIFGGLGFISGDSDDSGNITLTSTLPLALLDLSDPAPFVTYLRLFAKLADFYEQQLLGPDAPDMY
jgi:hypothetical protein